MIKNYTPNSDKCLYNLVGSNLRILFIHPKRYRSLPYLIQNKGASLCVLDTNELMAEYVNEIGGIFINGNINITTSMGKSEFDLVIIDETLFSYNDIGAAISQISRIGRYCLITMRNKTTLRNRLKFLLYGTTTNKFLKEKWYSNEYTRPCTINEFTELCIDRGITIERGCFYDKNLRLHSVYNLTKAPSLFSKKLFFITRTVNEKDK